MWNGMSADRFVRLPSNWYSRFEWNDIDALNHEICRVAKRSFRFRLKHVVAPSRFKSRTFSRWLTRSDKILIGSNLTHARRHTTRMGTNQSEQEREKDWFNYMRFWVAIAIRFDCGLLWFILVARCRRSTAVITVVYLQRTHLFPTHVRRFPFCLGSLFLLLLSIRFDQLP